MYPLISVVTMWKYRSYNLKSLEKHSFGGYPLWKQIHTKSYEFLYELNEIWDI